MDEFYPELRAFIAAAMEQATVSPRIFSSYEATVIPRERRQSFLGDSTQGGLLPFETEGSSDPPPSNQQASGGEVVQVELCDGSILQCIGQIIPA